MSEEFSKAVVESPRSTASHPALGLIATGENSEEILRELYRAVTNGSDVFLTYSAHPVPDVVEFARKAGANIVDPPEWDAEITTIEQQLVESIRIRTNRPVVVHREQVYTSTEIVREEVVTPDVVVAIPAYNEASSISRVVTDALSVADSVLVVDDGSHDETAERAEAAGATVVSHDENSGYGMALRTAFEKAAELGAAHLVTLDADGQHDVSDVPRLVARQRELDADIVIGSRRADGGNTDMPRIRGLGLSAINTLTNFSLGFWRAGSRIHDTQSGFRAYNSRAIGELSTSTDIGRGMGASTDILYHAHRHDYHIEEVGTTITYDVDGANTLHPLSHGYTLVRNIFRTVERDHPLSVLGVPGFVLIFLGLVLGYWGLQTYSTVGVVPVKMGLLASLFVLIGFLACFTAVILHALHTYFDPV